MARAPETPGSHLKGLPPVPVKLPNLPVGSLLPAGELEQPYPEVQGMTFPIAESRGGGLIEPLQSVGAGGCWLGRLGEWKVIKLG